jgi:hypothetical protein
MSDLLRVPHLLKRARAARFPARILCLGWDTEPVPGRAGAMVACDRLVSWCAVLLRGRRGRYRSSDPVSEGTPATLQQHLTSLTRSREPLWLLTPHAARLMSLAGLWGHLAGSDLDGVVLSDPPTILPMRLAPGCGVLTVLDTRNHGYAPVTGLLAPRESAADLAAWFQAVCALLMDERLGGLCRTAGAQAWHSWRYAHLDHLVEVHTHAPTLSLERAAYGPGRCECYRIGRVEGPVYHLDAHALYPHLLATHGLPRTRLGYAVDPPAGFAEWLTATHCTVAEVEIETAEPLAPYQSRPGAPVVWPVGRWRTTLCGPELASLISRGAIRHWCRVAWYASGPIGRAFAQHMIQLRDRFERGDAVGSWLKLVANCLPGRWGQSLSRWEDAPWLPCHPPWDAWTVPDGQGGIDRWRSLGWRTQREVRGQWGPEAVPAAAAYVVSLGRAYLWRAMEAAGRENVVYVDTDGLMVTRRGHERLTLSGFPSGGGPGEMSVRHVYPWVQIHGLRQWEALGIEQAAGKPLDPPAVSDDPGRVWVQVGPQGALAGGREPSAIRHLIPWSTPAVYRHGTVGSDGVVAPLEIDDVR